MSHIALVLKRGQYHSSLDDIYFAILCHRVYRPYERFSFFIFQAIVIKMINVAPRTDKHGK